MDKIMNRLNVLIYGILAGLAIALGGLLYILSITIIPNDFVIEPKLVGALLFPVGLLLVLYFKLNLYTGKIGVAFRNKKIDKKELNVFEWLLWILIGNAIGAFLLGIIVYVIQINTEGSAFNLAVMASGNSRVMAFTFSEIFKMTYKSILCGVLVYIAVYIFGKAKYNFEKVIGVIAAISFFVYAGFQHCVANMFYLAASGLWNINYLVGLLISIVGNSVGALLLDLFVKYE